MAPIPSGTTPQTCVFVSLSIQLRSCRLSDMEETVKEFVAKLALVPIPPPGQLHLVCVCVCH